MRSVLIIGYGVVGHNMAKIFPNAWVVDPRKGLERPSPPEDVINAMPERLEKKYPEHDGPFSVAFVCVPTDMLPDGRCDTSIVQRAVRKNDADVFCIKSTVPPGTTDRIHRETGRTCVFSPEFFGGTQHASGVDYDFVILGGGPIGRRAVAEVYKERMTGAFLIMQTDARTAELVKYAENAFLATKVTFFVEWARLCDAYGVDANEWRELLLLDPRIGRSHTYRYEDHPFYRSHCLDKDLPAAAAFSREAGFDAKLLKAVIAINDEWRRG